MRRAVIDIGTNSVKLLVAEVTDGVVTPLQEVSEQTRLGAGFYEAHQLQPSAIACTAEAVARFVEHARSSDAAVIRLIATSAGLYSQDETHLAAYVAASRDQKSFDAYLADYVRDAGSEEAYLDRVGARALARLSSGAAS